MSPDELLSVSPSEFNAMVDADLRGASEASLRDPRVLERWYLSLVGMKKSVEHQLGAKKAEHKAERFERGSLDPALEARYYRWVAASMRFKSTVELALAEARYLRLRRDEGTGEG